MERKTFDLVEIKADEETGTFTALASVFGNVDSVNDRMMPGSFAKTLEKWRESGRPIPVILSHQWDNLKAWIGKADPRAVYESEDGLVVQGQIDMEDPDARKAHKLMKEGLLTGWSFGYSVPKGGQKTAKDGVNEVKEVELYEVGPTLIGANREAQLQAVKSLAVEREIDPDEAEELAREVIEVGDEETSEKSQEPETASAPSDQGRDDEEPVEAKSQTSDPLKDDYELFRIVAEGIESEPPQAKKEPPPELPSPADLEQQFHRLMLEIVEGVDQ